MTMGRPTYTQCGSGTVIMSTLVANFYAKSTVNLYDKKLPQMKVELLW